MRITHTWLRFEDTEDGLNITSDIETDTEEMIEQAEFFRQLGTVRYFNPIPLVVSESKLLQAIGMK